MHLKFFRVSFVAGLVLIIGKMSHAAAPRVTNNHYELELVASDPQIVTPIGLAFDAKGRLLVVESHTHLRPEQYQGPAADRIRMSADSDGDGKLDLWTTFAEGFSRAMNLMVRNDGGVYVVTQHNVVLLRDTNDDGVADEQNEILRLETTNDYPHDALAGIAKPRDGKLLIGLGENFGKPYRLVGKDGTSVPGKDGAGCIFECAEDGTGLRRIATGLWNPFSICALPDGRIFTTDNDPDASPPCRMVHVVEGGDYGFRFQYGRAGTHPLQAWNGELPGTLPYVCGLGEAPTAMVALGKWLWVTSWGDHRIDRYELEPRGASYGAKRETIVQGDTDFRPTGMAIAPDGSLYFGDWVLKDYPVHGHGHIWRLKVPPEEKSVGFPMRSPQEVAISKRPGLSLQDATSDDPYTHAHAVWQLSKSAGPLVAAPSATPRMRLAMLEAARLSGITHPEALLARGLLDESSDVRLFAVRWIADERIIALRDELNALLDAPPPSRRYYLAVLGAIDWLSHEPKMTGTGIAGDLLVQELKNDRRSMETQTLALSLLNPDNKFLSLDRLRGYLKSSHTPLRIEAVRSLSQQSSAERFSLLAEVAQDGSQPEDVRVEAVVGLAAATADHRELLERLAEGDPSALRDEARRSLRLAGLGPGPSETKPPVTDVLALQKLLSTGGNASAGRRLFFNPVGARCYLCHSYAGRGGNVGPELTKIGSSTSRDKIVASIIQPSQEIAPDYQPWELVTEEGRVYTGLRLPQPGDDGKEHYVDSSAKEFVLPSETIAERKVATKSIMPENLQAMLSIDDLRDLVAFLSSTSTEQK
jgi:putative membrane-bound dehydrogenase-like protein